MDPSFGEFITKEYGLLKQILSYLTKPDDLYRARLVCREWRKAVDNLVEKKPIVISYKHGQKDPMPLPNTPILPHLVIFQNVVKKEYLKPKCTVCKQRLMICDCRLMGPRTGMLKLGPSFSKTPYKPELYSFTQLPSVLLLKCPENVEIKTYSLISSLKGPYPENMNDFDESIKALFVVCKSTHRKISEKILNALVDSRGPTFALGGGISDGFFYREGYNEFTKGGLFIEFKGDNVKAHSTLINENDTASMENAIAKLRENAGEVPEDGVQVAFIAQCVDRRHLEKQESSLFRKYFPNTPQFGFTAWGEFGLKNGNSEESPKQNKSKKKKLEFSYVFTTSILIVTIRKTKT
ncbi:F-box only protein 22-like isoform X4 [Macrosteles quadrilineatus]|uniref:F-box only protein 22-like isoform X4 n=1 Tax=Macrosteles quadrilineatus TaxID=74068 RepID=UPI0023E11FD4|nr:F-box only protein 22-like isoform X4 [Macrosteles quadrilineatus]